MVRLVFRPYTQIRRTICTSVSLRASTKVSFGFTLFRHSSPSFGSQQICSYSNLPQAVDRSMVPLAVPTSALAIEGLHFHCASGFSTQILAHMLDSLVRVSRRVEEKHFVKISNVLLRTALAVGKARASSDSTCASGFECAPKGVRCLPQSDPQRATDFEQAPKTALLLRTQLILTHASLQDPYALNSIGSQRSPFGNRAARKVTRR
jgi:hypothetical protein